jgi:GAF domain-containing protein
VADQNQITKTFVELADTLVDDYDLIEFTQLLVVRSVELLGMADAGVILSGRGDELQVLASSSELMRFMELIEVQVDDGPCYEAWRDGAVVRSHSLEHDRDRWPKFAPLAVDAGFRSAYGVPMRLRYQCIGALNLFAEETHGLDEDDEQLARALAEMATIGILHARYARDKVTLAEQLQAALNSRVTIEQAKGIVAAQADLEVDDAFALLRRHARRHNRRLTDVACDVIERRIRAAELMAEDTAGADAQPTRLGRPRVLSGGKPTASDLVAPDPGTL